MGPGIVVYAVTDEHGAYMVAEADGFMFSYKFTSATLFYDRDTAEGYCKLFNFPTEVVAFEVCRLNSEDNKN